MQWFFFVQLCCIDRNSLSVHTGWLSRIWDFTNESNQESILVDSITRSQLSDGPRSQRLISGCVLKIEPANDRFTLCLYNSGTLRLDCFVACAERHTLLMKSDMSSGLGISPFNKCDSTSLPKWKASIASSARLDDRYANLVSATLKSTPKWSP